MATSSALIKMLSTGKMALLALALLTLTMTVDAQKRKYINGTAIFEKYFKLINFTSPFKEPFANVQPSMLRDAQVFTLTEAERYTFTNSDLATRGLAQYNYNYIETYMQGNIEAGIDYVDDTEFLDSWTYPDWQNKYHVQKVSFDDATIACESLQSYLYQNYHSVRSDSAIAINRKGLSPWFNRKKPKMEGGSELLCAYLRSYGIDVNIQWASCDDLHVYVCQKLKVSSFKDSPKNVTSLAKKTLKKTSADHTLSKSPLSSAKDLKAHEGRVWEYEPFYSAIDAMRKLTGIQARYFIKYLPQEYVAYNEAQDRLLKYYSTPMSWDDAKATCTADGATLYSSEHSLQLDAVMIAYFPPLTPWLNEQKDSGNSPGEKYCAYLDLTNAGPGIFWTDCSNPQAFICQRIICLEC